jgi:hypothetical protein
MQDLGLFRLHSFTLARGQDDRDWSLHEVKSLKIRARVFFNDPTKQKESRSMIERSCRGRQTAENDLSVQKKLPDQIDADFVRRIQAALLGLIAILINHDDLVDTLSHGGKAVSF